MNTYKLDDKEYDVSKLDKAGQTLFSALVAADTEANELRKRLLIFIEAANSIKLKLDSKLTDDALIRKVEDYASDLR